MKRIIIICSLTLFVFILATIGFAQDTKTFNTPGKYPVGAAIDERCIPRATMFTIAPGMSASNFQVNHFVPGYNCYTSAPLTELGFQIIDSATGVTFYDSGIQTDRRN